MNHPNPHRDQYHQQWLVRFQNKTHVIDLVGRDGGEDDASTQEQKNHDHPTDQLTQTNTVPDRLLSILAERTKWPLQYLYVVNENNCRISYPFVTVSVRSCILGGKGGFGTLLKGQSRQAGAKLTTDFGACRDLQGRRLRHVNDEIKLRKFRDRQRREAAGEKIDVDELYKTPSGIYNWHLMTPTWADISKKAAYKIRRQFQNMEKADKRKADLQKEKDEVYQKSMTMYLDETTAQSQSIQSELNDALKQGLLQRQKQKQQQKLSVSDTNMVKKRKRPDDDDAHTTKTHAVDDVNGTDDQSQLQEQPNALVSLSGDVVVSESSSSNNAQEKNKIPSSSSVQMQSKSEFMTAVLVLDGLPASTANSPDTSTVIYYEVTIVTGGLAQIGWASLTGDMSTKESSSAVAASAGGGGSSSSGFTPNNDLGDGVGDDAFSFGIDLSRGLKFHGGEDWEYGKGLKWKPGDRLGCSWNQSTGEITFTLNGQPLLDSNDTTVAFTNTNFHYLFPAFSCNQGEILELHLKQEDCLYIPKDNCKVNFIPVGELLQVDTEPKRSKKEDVSNNNADAQELQPLSSLAECSTSGSNNSDKNTADKPTLETKSVPSTATKERTKPEPIDLSKYDSAKELEELGLDRLKSGLLAIHAKCGGTLEERAKRLFSLKGLHPKDYPAKVLLPAKRGRTQTSKGNAARGMILISSFVFAVFVVIVGIASPIASTCSAQAISDDINREEDSLYSDTYRYRNRQLLGLRGALSGEETETLGPKSAITSSVSPIPSTNLTIPLHAHSGSHHVHLYVGSPPQRQIVILDTGSKSLSFPCKCKGCSIMEGHASPIFDSSESTTHIRSKCGSCHLEGISTCSLVDNSCTFAQKYTEGSSWTAVEVEDMIYFGTSNVQEIDDYMDSAVAYSFGCQTSRAGLFEKQYADGILGLSIHATSLIAAIFEAGVISHYAFSLCLTQEGGYLSLGGVKQDTHHWWEGVKMTPIIRDHGYYSVQITKIMVGSEVVASSKMNHHLLKDLNGGKGALIDSGTTDTFFPSSLSSFVGPLISDLTDGQVDFSDTTRRRLFSFAEFKKMPDVTVIFGNDTILKIRPEYYMEGVPLAQPGEILAWKERRSLTNRLYFDEKQGTVFGMNSLIGNEILFDVQGRRIGFLPSSCTRK